MEIQDITTGMKFHKDKMPKNYINEQKKREVIALVKTELEDLNKLASELTAKHVMVNSLETLQTLSVDGCKKTFFDELRKNADTFHFSQELVQQFSIQYTKDWQVVEPLIREVIGIRNKYQELTFLMSEDGFSLNDEEVLQYATNQATRHTTKEERDLYELYREMIRATVAVAKFESENGWIEVAKDGYGGLSAYSILTGRRLDYGKVITSDPEELTPERFIFLLDHISPIKKKTK